MQSLFILNNAGEIIIEKHYRGLMNRSVCDQFWIEVLKYKDPKEAKPVISISKWYLIHVQHNTLFFLAVLQSEAPPLQVIEGLNSVVEVFKHYMSEITEDSIKDQFVPVYQLLDEMFDYGIPFSTYPNALTGMIGSSNVFKDLLGPGGITGYDVGMEPNSFLGGSGSGFTPNRQNLGTGMRLTGFGSESLGSPATGRSSLTNTGIGSNTNGIAAGNAGGGNMAGVGGTNTVPWRSLEKEHTLNEVYFDIIEEIDCIIGRNGRIITSELFGTVTSECNLSGTPHMSMFFNNTRVIESVSFHPCVKLKDWDNAKVVNFIPPDGKFTLLDFTVSRAQNIDLPLFITPVLNWNSNPPSKEIPIELSGGTGNLQLTVASKAYMKTDLEDIVITVIFPKGVSSTSLVGTVGVVSYDEIAKVLVWRIKMLPRDKPSVLSGSIIVPSGSQRVGPTVEVQFTAMKYSAIGLTIDSLQITEINYKPRKAVRSITKAGKFEVRLQ